MLDINSTVTLNNGLKMPLLGIGTYQVSNGKTTYDAVRYSLDIGYRHIDTARFYGNEESVGKAVRDSGIPRAEIWVTTKQYLFYGFNADSLFEDSFKKLGLDYVDLLLIHFPVPLIVKSNWKKIEKIYSLGTVKSIGVSNHTIPQINEVLGIASVKPVLNQIKCSPYNYNPKMYAYLKEKNMYMEAYSPLTRGKKLNDEKLLKLAKKYNKTTAQILIRWCLQKDIIVIPKSTHKERIKENRDVYNFEITKEDVDELDNFSSKEK